MGWFRRHRWVARASAAIGGLVLLTIVLSAVSTAQQHAWETDCVSQGGQVVQEARFDDNHAVLVQSTGPVYRCLDVRGSVISVRA